MKEYFKELNHLVSAETLLNYPYWNITFTVHTDAYDKKLGAVISHNNKPISLLLRISSKPHRNYNKTYKEISQY